MRINMQKLNVNKLITSISKIKNAVQIHEDDCPHLTPPLLKIHQPADGKNKYPTPRNIGLNRPIISDEDYTRRAISVASDEKEDWPRESILGTEALAWYVSFHVSNYWGIYIPHTGLLRHAHKFLQITNSANVATQISYDALIAHESIHYGIDIACARLELISNRAVYISGKNSLRSPLGYNEMEEQIAEGVLLHTLQNYKNEDLKLHPNIVTKIFETAKQHTLRLPPGYRDAIKCISPKDFRFCTNGYLEDLFAQGVTPHRLSEDLVELIHLLPIKKAGFFQPNRIDYSECPIYIFDDTQKGSSLSNAIYFISQLSSIQETAAFKDKVRPHQVRWDKTKQLLSHPDYKKNNRNLKFERWPKADDPEKKYEAWHVRVGKKTNLRAQINHFRETNEWVAVDIGDANKMGHHKNR